MGIPMITVMMTAMVMMVTVTILMSQSPMSPMNTRAPAQNSDRRNPPTQWVTKNTPSTMTGHGSQRKNKSVCFRQVRIKVPTGFSRNANASGSQSANVSMGSCTGWTSAPGNVLSPPESL